MEKNTQRIIPFFVKRSEEKKDTLEKEELLQTNYHLPYFLCGKFGDKHIYLPTYTNIFRYVLGNNFLLGLIKNIFVANDRPTTIKTDNVHAFLVL